MKRKSKLIILIAFMSFIYLLHAGIMRALYFESSWWFFDQNWSYPFIHSWQAAFTLIIFSYLLFLFSIYIIIRLKRKGAFFISVSFALLFFFLSGQYVTITDIVMYGDGESKPGYQNFRIAEKFSIFTIRSKTFDVKADSYKFEYEDNFLQRTYPTIEGNFSVINGFLGCFRLHDNKWSRFHLFYHQGNKSKIPPEKNPEDYK